jgi:DNA-binding transcriptional LysR family regulator
MFAKLAETGSFGGTAAELGLSSATVSKVLKRLEAHVGERLIHRTSRRFALTETGRALALRAAQILAEGEAVEAEAEAGAKSATPRGRVRLAAPMSFGLRHVAPALPDFLAAYPEVSVDLQLDDQMVDLVARGMDLAVRIADLPDSSLLVHRICSVRRWVVATPAYFARHGTPRRPRDLKDHACLCYSYLATGESWRFTSEDGIEEAVTVRGPLSATNAEALSHALESGLGIALQPDFLAWEAVADGRLKPVLEDWSAPPMTLNLLTPGGGPRATRVRVLLEFLLRRFKSGTAPWTLVAPRRNLAG